ncbi:MAG: hypothetical protein P9M14_06995 [Candidatus Alcyoniella australis]|nr:hypothetical protein [Candidatus Alcyoniella australis]
MKRCLLICVIVCSFLIAGLALGSDKKIDPGTAVFAEWTSNGWFHGKVTGPCAAGFQILFDDGDQKCCALMQIAVDMVPAAADVQVGTKVIAQWSDGRFYPGTVGAINGNKYDIQYNDGDKGTLGLSQIRLR